MVPHREWRSEWIPAPVPSWRQNWVLVAEETGRRGGHSEGGELWKPRQYIPWKGAGEDR